MNEGRTLQINAAGEETLGAKPVLQAKSISKSYLQGADQLQILNDCDLEVHAGERVAILGRSGSGKSTLLHILAGLDDADSGGVFVAGEELSAANAAGRAAMRARSMGFVYQAHHLLPEFSALENVAMPLRLQGARSAQAATAAVSMLEQVGLGDRLKHRPSALSGGERQRVAVARALVAQPAVVLADEPTGNLDAHNAQAVFDLICNLSEATSTAFVIVTHDETLAKRLDRALVLDGGRLVSL